MWVYEAMVAHVRGVLPAEGCGFLAGRDGVVRSHHPIENVAADLWRFEMNAREQVAAHVAIEESGEVLLAIYHSHPRGTAVLSATDLAEMTYADVVQVVVAVGDGAVVVRGFRVVDGRVSEVAVKVE